MARPNYRRGTVALPPRYRRAIAVLPPRYQRVTAALLPRYRHATTAILRDGCTDDLCSLDGFRFKRLCGRL